VTWIGPSCFFTSRTAATASVPSPLRRVGERLLRTLSPRDQSRLRQLLEDCLNGF
jgi:hypothetical protein